MSTSSTFDFIVVTCSNCHAVSNHTPPQPLVGAKAMKEWLSLQTTQCAACGSDLRTITPHVLATP